MKLAPLTCEIRDDQARISKGDWSMTVPVDQLPQWLRFYRGFAAHEAKASIYAPCVTAIEAAMIRAGLRVPPKENHTTRKK